MYEMVINTRHEIVSVEKLLNRNKSYQGIIKLISFRSWFIQFELSRYKRYNIILSKIQWKSISRSLFEGKWTFWAHKSVAHCRFFFVIFFKFILSQKCLCDPMWLRFWIFTFLPHSSSWFLCLRKGWLVIIWLKCSVIMVFTYSSLLSYQTHVPFQLLEMEVRKSVLTSQKKMPF